MSKLDRAAVALGIVATLETIYDRYIQRKRAKENTANDQRIRDLEFRLAKLERAKS